VTPDARGRLATRQEAADHCRVSLRTFEREVAPHLTRLQIGARVLYEWAELDRWLDAQKVGPSRKTDGPGSTSSASASQAGATTTRRARAIAAEL
jgi:hypothetical protein